mgnify:FL=1
MTEKRLNEIAERKAAILTEMDAANAEQLRSLNTEADKLNEEEAQLRGKMTLKGKVQP